MIYVALAVLFVAALLFQAWQFGRERERWQAAQDKLIEKVQAPEKALLYEANEISPPVPYDDDEAFFLAKQESSGDN